MLSTNRRLTMKRANKTDNVLLVKGQFKLWLEEEQKK